MFPGSKTELKFLSSLKRNGKLRQEIKQLCGPFNSNIFLIIIFTSFCNTWALFLIETISNTALVKSNKKVHKSTTFCGISKWTFRPLLDQSLYSYELPLAYAPRLVLALWFCFCITISGLYRSALISVLVKPEEFGFLKSFQCEHNSIISLS